jgi:hypothetical protein
MPQCIRIHLHELPAPISHSLADQDDAAPGHQVFDIAAAEAETKDSRPSD